LIATSSAFLSLHRSEGFGRGPAEAMLLGVPVTLTDYSGTQDFGTPDCTLLVDHELVPVRPEEYPGEGQCWAEAIAAAAADHLRWIHQNRPKAKMLAARGRQQIMRMYDRRQVGREMLAALGIDHEHPQPSETRVVSPRVV
jgi:glycosyltransferase involved in cell wall biosynthesis